MLRYHLLQELDGQTQCHHFGEHVIEIGSMVSEICNFFMIFQVTHFPPEKGRLSCVVTSFHTTLFYKP